MKKTVRLDGWANVLTGLGVAARDKLAHSRIQRTTTLDRQTLDTLYHESALMRRIVERPAKDMTRKWIEVTIDGEPDAARELSQALEVIAARRAVFQALTWARLYGGALLLVGADDGQEKSAEPLAEDRVRSVSWLHALHRHQVRPIGEQLDPTLPGFGLPEGYEILPQAGSRMTPGTVVHASRTIRFTGLATTPERKRHLEGWDESTLTPVYEIARDFEMGMKGAAHLLADFAQAVFRIKGLAQMLASGQDERVLQRLALLDMSRSIARAVPLDTEEELERKSTPIAGMPELLDRLAQQVSIATGIPQTVLLGRSPAGLDATGESDLSLWYDLIGAEQEDTLRDPIERLARLVLVSKEGPTRGIEPERWSFRFRPLWQESLKEQAETRHLVAQTDAIYASMPGGLTGAEIIASRYGAGEWSPETALLLSADERRAASRPLLPLESAEEQGEAPTAEAPAPAEESVTTGLQETALNGAQVTALSGIIESVSIGVITRETALPLILSAFPAIPEDRVRAMLAGVVVKERDLGKPEAAPSEDERGDQRELDLSEKAIAALRPERLEKRLPVKLKRALRSVAEEVMSDLGLDPRKMSFDLLNPLIKDYLAEYSGTRGLLAEMTATQRDILRTALRESSTKGEGHSDRTRRIRELFGDASEARIRAIAQTEAHSAVSWATNQAHKMSGVVTKVKWVHQGPSEGGEREGHAAMDGQTVDLGEMFTNPLTGNQAEAPGQFGLAEEDINCRCATVATIDLSEEPDEEFDDEIPQPRDDARALTDKEQIARHESREQKLAAEIEKELWAAFAEWAADVLKAI